LKLARLILLQPLLLMIAIGWIVKLEYPQQQINQIPSDHALPGVGEIILPSPIPAELFQPVMPTLAPAEAPATLSPNSPGLSDFTQSIVHSEPGQVTAVFAAEIFDLLVEQQPPNHSMYVTEKEGYATQFSRPARYDVIGLLAHNTHSGILFYGLDIGHEVYVIMGDGQVLRYEVATISDFQKLQPGNSRSDYVDLESGLRMSTDEVFNRFYKNGPHLTLQTCLEREQNKSWGVRFIVALPLEMTSR
jgi:hypothetical protein